VRHVRRELGDRRVVPAVRLGELPLHPLRVRLPPVQTPGHAVSQVPVAAQPALLPAQVSTPIGRRRNAVRSAPQKSIFHCR
jgi:hypothetical protein